MSAAFEAHRRYLRALRESCSLHPEVHRHQLAAIERELDRERLDATQFEVTRCAYLDRAANSIRVASLTGDLAGARAAGIEFEACASAAGYGAWLDCLTAGGTKSAKTRAAGHEAQSTFVTLILSLMRMRAEFRPAYRGQVHAEASEAARVLLLADPDCGWNKPRYAFRLPWSEPALATIRRWAPLPDSPEPDPAPPTPRFEFPDLADNLAPPGPADAAAPYRAIADSPYFPAITRGIAAEMSAVASAAATPQDAAAIFVSSGLLTRFAAAPWRVAAEDALKRRVRWPDPLIEHHWRALLAGLDSARTPTEVELVIAHASACFAVEADWNTLMFTSLSAPLRAACIAGWDASAAATDGLNGAVAMTRELTGLDASAIASLPLVASYIEHVMNPVAADPDPSWGAYHGEPGCDLAAEARVLAGATGLRPFADLLSGVQSPPAEPLPFRLWNTPILPSDLSQALTKPSRPAIPGL